MDVNVSELSKGERNSFHQFLLLPREIQFRIWRLAIWPRTIAVAIESKSEERSFYIEYVDPVPAVMHACRDSRRESSYTHAFSSAGDPSYLWVNFNYDTIHMSYEEMNLMAEEDFTRMRMLKLYVDDVDSFFEIHLEGGDDLRSLKALMSTFRYEATHWWRYSLSEIRRRVEEQFGTSKVTTMFEKELPSVGVKLGNYLDFVSGENWRCRG